MRRGSAAAGADCESETADACGRVSADKSGGVQTERERSQLEEMSESAEEGASREIGTASPTCEGGRAEPASEPEGGLRDCGHVKRQKQGWSAEKRKYCSERELVSKHQL